ncbi:VCBS repeat-containing protein [Costertonia aggregata]|uniref:VCBS repeat-containing protein n=1 Tax=Costertonia aggregata TaxID=343403 RepID=UPI001D15D184|nr:VCBS repeat-containing protein [Costertonia aggregata]
MDKDYLFKKLPYDVTGIDFINQIEEDPIHNIINYIYYYNGGGVAVGDINNDGLSDIFFVSNQRENKLYLNKGGLKFEDVTTSSKISSASSWNTGATMVDVNGDGYLDIYLCAVSGLLDFKGHNELFINNGDGTFSEKSKEYGLDFKGFSTQSYFFDYDKDDDLDVYIVNHAIHTTLSHGPADARNKREPLVGDVLLKNENGKFIDVSEHTNIYGGVNGYGLSASIADYNNDGWEDIYVCNDFHEDDYYYINNQDGTFKESLSKSFSTISRFSMGSDAADINNDGFTDLVTLDMLPSDERLVKETEGDDAMFNMQNQLKNLGYKDQYSRNMLQINKFGKYFQETAFLNGVSSTDWSWAPLLADFNNDGYQDLFITNGILRRPNYLDFKQYVSSAFKNRSPNKGTQWLYNSINEMPSGEVANQIFKGGLEKFTNESGNWIPDTPSFSNGAVYSDLDNDGDLDIVVNNLNNVADIYENLSNEEKNYISLNFEYRDKNSRGIGTKALIYTKNKMQSKRLLKSRGFLSSVDSKLNFGLDTVSKIDSIKIIWPNLDVKTLINPQVNQNLLVRYSPSTVKYDYQVESSKPYFEESKEFEYIHSEDLYNDFRQERLIPYQVSKQGPAFAVGDIDNNGYDDIFIGNSSGNKPVMFKNNGKRFLKTSIPTIELDSLCEDNAALFFDVDNDNDLDLYVASGITSLKNGKSLQDRLYINKNGNFEKSENRIPINNFVTSSVVASDYDQDGDLDLFVGNLSKPDDFGECVNSFLLKNDGSGYFSVDDNFKLCSMVNDAIWKDVNMDGIEDLLVATDWDTPKVFINDNRSLIEIDLPQNMKGLWQSITSFDIDEDGDQDIILGNWGLNTKFSLNPPPLKMYKNDFDSDGRNEVIVAYNVNGKYYPINSRDEISSQMKVISKRFISYKDFALKTVEDIVGKEAVKKSEKYEVQNLASGYLENINGKFERFVFLSNDFQLAPISSFSEIEIKDDKCLLVTGNSLKVNTYHGGYTSLKGIVLNDMNQFEPVVNFGIQHMDAQIKGSVVIEMKNRKVLFILANNDTIKSYSYDSIE